MREKLIELLTHDDCPLLLVLGEISNLANFLVAHGVTVQKWIPVTERLPEDGEVVLVYGTRGGIYTAYANRGGWHKMNSKSHYCNPTHWMPLPEPPKE